MIPSSRFLERRLVALSGARHARLLVELGPGTGGTTRALLRALPADAKLLAVELEPRFASILREMGDPRLIVHEGSAEHLLDTLRDARARRAGRGDLRHPLLDDGRARSAAASRRPIHDALGPSGRFVAYQVRGKVHDVARPFFGRAQVDVELRNIPPMRIYRWRKDEVLGAARMKLPLLWDPALDAHVAETRRLQREAAEGRDAGALDAGGDREGARPHPDDGRDLRDAEARGLRGPHDPGPGRPDPAARVRTARWCARSTSTSTAAASSWARPR